MDESLQAPVFEKQMCSIHLIWSWHLQTLAAPRLYRKGLFSKIGIDRSVLCGARIFLGESLVLPAT